jgi:hypothetical protein
MKTILLASILMLFGCANTSTEYQQPSLFGTVTGTTTNAMPLIEQVSAVAPNTVEGNFIFDVKAAKTIWPYTYLNTEQDYRDRRNITIRVFAGVERAIRLTHGKSVEEYFANGRIAVNGEAKRVKIVFYSQGKPTESYYYQIHIDVTSAEQISLLPAE